MCERNSSAGLYSVGCTVREICRGREGYSSFDRVYYEADRDFMELEEQESMYTRDGSEETAVRGAGPRVDVIVALAM